MGLRRYSLPSECHSYVVASERSLSRRAELGARQEAAATWILSTKILRQEALAETRRLLAAAKAEIVDARATSEAEASTRLEEMVTTMQALRDSET